jgi:predicted nucleotidyltransferase
MAYKTQSVDTSLEAEQLQLTILRQKGAAGRLKACLKISVRLKTAGWHNFRLLHAELPLHVQFSQFIQAQHGVVIPPEFLTRRQGYMNEEDLLASILPVADVLESLGVKYAIAGSVASSIHGILRSTSDVDIVADLTEAKIETFCDLLKEDFYLSETAIREAINRKSSFNLIHLASGGKVDIFILKPDAFNQNGIERAVSISLFPEINRFLKVESPEDTILSKLNWYKLGGYTSNNQWLDVLGVIKLKAATLDLAYLKTWAEKLALSELLERALAEGGLNP